MRARALTRVGLGIGLLAMAGCGDPVVIQGDLPGIMRVVAGAPPDGSVPSGVALAAPRALVVAETGSVYLTDPPTRTVYEIGPSGSTRTVVSHSGCSGVDCMKRPEAIARTAEGDLLVADPSAGRVWLVSATSGAVSTLAGSPGAEPARPGAVALDVSFAEPSGVAAAPDGGVYVSERNGHRIWRIERNGVLTAVAGVGTAGHRDGSAGQSWFRNPAGLALAGGVLFVADQGNHRIRAIDLQAGQVTSPVGRGTATFTGDNGPAHNAGLASPEAVAVSADGVSMFVADKGNHRIRRVNLVTGLITTYAGTGDADFLATGLEAGATPLGSPSGVAVLESAFLFVADTDNGLVWRTPVGR